MQATRGCITLQISNDMFYVCTLEQRRFVCWNDTGNFTLEDSMREYLELGSSPCDEDCKQLGKDSHDEILAEVKRYRNELQTLFPIPANLDGKVRFGIKAFPHEFGTYYEVVIYYDETDENAAGFAFHVEGNIPENWSQP